MIAKIRGLLDATGVGWAVVDVAGVGYQVACTSRTLNWLVNTQPEVELLVHTSARDHAIELFGFRDEAERAWFRALLTVQGIGAKTALAVLDALGPAELEQAIAADDSKAVVRAEGVGAKAASRIIAELKHRITSLAKVTDSAQKPGDHAYRDAVEAMVALGYGRLEAVAALTATQADHPEGQAEELVKHALRTIGR